MPVPKYLETVEKGFMGSELKSYQQDDDVLACFLAVLFELKHLEGKRKRDLLS